MTKKDLRKAAVPLGGWIILFFILESVSQFVINDSLLFPSPTIIVYEAGLNLIDPLFLSNAGSTLKETAISTLFALSCGVPVGLLVGRYSLLTDLLMSPIDWLRSIPATALFPVFLLLFGIGQEARISIACYASIFAVILPTIYGARSVDDDRIDHMNRAGLNKIQIFIHVVFWESLPSIVSGTRLAISSALVLIVVGEMFIGSNEGLGYLISNYQDRYQTTQMYASIVDVGIFGYLVNKVIRYIEKSIQ